MYIRESSHPGSLPGKPIPNDDLNPVENGLARRWILMCITETAGTGKVCRGNTSWSNRRQSGSTSLRSRRDRKVLK